MPDLTFSTETDRPAKSWIWNQAEIAQVRTGKKIRIDFDESPQNAFRYDLGAHRPVQEEIEIFRGPLRDLGRIDSCFHRLVGRSGNERAAGRDRED